MMKTLILNTTRFFCTSGMCAATDCRCPKVERVPYPSIREWWSDTEHRQQTLIVAAIALIVVLSGIFMSWVQK